MSAVVGKHQLEHLEEFLLKRNQVAKWYQEALANIEGISLFHTPPKSRHSYYKYPVRLADWLSREELAAILKDKYGVETGHVYYPPCHLQPFYMQEFGFKVGNFPIAEQVLNKVMCLPMHCEITQENVEYIAESLATSIRKLSETS